MSDIIAITDSNKNIVAEYRYDPWGKVLNEDDLTAIGNLNPFRYRSYYYDSDIEMYYLQSRYYDAEVGRFVNCDDVNYIEKVVFYSEFAEKNRSYEITLLTGSAYAWTSYIASISVNGNRDVLPKIISLLGVIVSIIGIVYPGISIDVLGYCITAVGIFYDGMESGANAWSGKFYKYILDSTALLDASEFLSIIYQVYLIEKTNGKVIRTKIYDIERDL